MAINSETLELLEHNRQIINGEDVVMIWRQCNDLSSNQLNWTYSFLKWEIYCEKLWTFLRTKNIYSLDASNYETPTFIHNMNDEIGNDLTNKFDVVFDGWSSEHIFNIPTVFNNYKKMLKKWWYYIWVLPANNWCNHWFYQFSPDFFYRMFSEEVWYKTKVFVKICNTWYKIKDLKDLNFPVHFNLFLWNKPALLYIISEKIEENIEIIPLQTVYNMHIWEKKNSQEINKKQSSLFKIFNIITPMFIKMKLWQIKNQNLVLEKINAPTF